MHAFHKKSLNLKQRIVVVGIFLLIVVIVVNLGIIFSLNAPLSNTATLQKTELDSKAQAVVTVCKDEKKWDSCYPKMFETLGKEYDLAVTTELLKKIIAKDGRVNDCHVIAHQIMRSEVAKNPDAWKKLLGIADPNLCNYGFIHGIIEGRAASDPTFSVNAKVIDEFCSIMQEEKKIRGVSQGCSHIMGHMLLLLNKGDVTPAYEVCKKVAVPLQVQCSAGITMESFTRVNLVEHGFGKYVRWDDDLISDLEKRCLSFSGTIAEGCWVMVSHLYNNRSPFNKDAVKADCKKAQTLELEKACYSYAVATLIKNPAATKQYYASLCSVYTDQNFTSRCLFTAVKGLLNSSIVPSRVAITYCQALSSQKNACFADIAALLSMRGLSQQEVEEYCSNAPLEDQKRCRGYAN